MPPKPSQLESIKSVLQLMKSQVTREEFTDSIKEILQFVKATRTMFSQEFLAMRREFAILKQDTTAHFAPEMEQMKQATMAYVRAEMQKMLDAHDKKMQAVDLKLDMVQDGEPGIPGKDGSPDTPEELLRKLALLGIPLTDDLNAFEKRVNKRIDSIPRGGARSSHSTRLTDLSAQTNGSLKVFAVPEGLSGLLFSSDFPSVLMEGNGFTLNKTRTQLTMTTTNAPSAGSQLVFQSTDIANY